MSDIVKLYKDIADRNNAVGDGFCVLKWWHLEMHLGTGNYHSCFHCPQQNLKLGEDIHNTLHKIQQRKTRLRGGRPEECSYCWKAEDAGAVSPRTTLSAIYTEMQPDIIETTASLEWDEYVYPKYLEMSFSNTCQMKCSYCAPSLSSTLLKEIKDMGAYPLKDPESRGQYELNGTEELYKDDNNPLVKKFWSWFDTAIEHLDTLRITGGEPLLHKGMFDMLEYLKNSPHDINFHVNSNLSISNRRVKQTCDLLPSKSKVYASVDTYGKQAEWIRHGLDWELFEENVLTVIDHGIPISFMTTFCLLSIPNFKDFLYYVIQLKDIGDVKIDTPFMTNPPHLSCLIMDDKMRDMLEDSYQFMVENSEFNEAEVIKFERVLKWVDNNRYTGERLNRHRRDFKTFVDEHDKRRGSNWHDAFPELKYFYELCDV
jgi:organic radical activating enzyme